MGRQGPGATKPKAKPGFGDLLSEIEEEEKPTVLFPLAHMVVFWGFCLFASI